MTERPTRLKLAQLYSGDLPAEEAAALQQQIEADAELAAQYAALQRNATEYEARAAVHQARLVERMGAGRRRLPRARWLVPVAASLAAAAALVLVIARPGPEPPVGPVIYKGQLALRIVAKRGERQFAVEQGTTLQAGDDLRFVVTSATPGYLSIFSVDGAGKLSSFYPSSDPAADRRPLSLERSGQQTLPGSIVLDDAPGPEHLVAAFSARAFDRRRLHEQVRRRVAQGRVAREREGALRGILDGEILLVTVKKGQAP